MGRADVTDDSNYTQVRTVWPSNVIIKKVIIERNRNKKY